MVDKEMINKTEYVESIEENRLLDLYNFIKDFVIKKGYKQEIEWCSNIPEIEKIDKWDFFSQYTWVVINSGMNNNVARKIFDRFWNKGNFDFDAIKHPHKNKSVIEVFNHLNRHFENFKRSKNRLKYIESLPHIGKITRYHLARNLGLDYAKPDRHLVRITSLLKFNNVQKFCGKISNLSGDKIGLVDLVFWRFATLNDNYINIIQEVMEESNTD